MDFNSIIFPSPKSSYTAQTLFGNIVYMPKYKQFSISEIQAFQSTLPLAKQTITTPANSQKPKHFVFDNVPFRSQECDFFERVYVPCLFLPYDAGSSKVLLYFHGNAEDIGAALPLLDVIKHQLKMHIVAVEYPGYGIYKGKPSAAKILEDADYVFSFLTKMLGVRPSDIIVFGRSIGSGPATYLASKHKVFSLLLMSPYTSIRSVAKHILGKVGQFLVAERFRNVDYMRNVKSPVMIIHGLKDPLIPYTQAQELCEHCNVPAVLVLPENMDHNVFQIDEDFLLPVRCFLERHEYNPKPGKKLAVPDRLFVRPLTGNRHEEEDRKTFLSWLFS